jgi:predicted site-specific integrase-resolvase
MSTYSIAEFARLTGLSVKTLQRWDRLGKLKPGRTPTNRRSYSAQQLAQIAGIQRQVARVSVVYCRVSRQAQKPELQNQRACLETFCLAKGFEIDEWIEEIGGGLNFKRPQFVKLFERIIAGEIHLLVLAHQDRLARFGFDFLQHLCVTYGCELRVMNTESLSPEREMVEDLRTITHCFSARLDGLRNYQKALKKALQHDKGA